VIRRAEEKSAETSPHPMPSGVGIIEPVLNSAGEEPGPAGGRPAYEHQTKRCRVNKRERSSAGASVDGVRKRANCRRGFDR
jgi:hypothetical protein